MGETNEMVKQKKRILFNFSNLQKGGALQVALSYIEKYNLLDKQSIDYEIYFSFSSSLYDYISQCKVSTHGLNYIILRENIASIKERRRAIEKLDEFESQVRPYSVFTLFGPSYWNTNCKLHLMGYAIPHYVFSDSPFFSKISIKNKIRIILKKYYHLYYFKRDASRFIVESNIVKDRLSQLLKLSVGTVTVASNTYHQIYDSPTLWQDVALPIKKTGEYWLLMMGANYIHKNISILLDLIPILERNEADIKFILTIGEEEFKSTYTSDESITKKIIFVGPTTVYQSPNLYKASDFLFFPTLLECFSATYVEAMKMKVPILTSNLPFATDICSDAAIYFDPLDAIGIASKINYLIANKEISSSLVLKGAERLRAFNSSEERFKKVISFLT